MKLTDEQRAEVERIRVAHFRAFREYAMSEKGAIPEPASVYEAMYAAGYRLGFEAAREAAAKVCDELDKGFGGMPIYEIAERIRAIPLPGGEK